MDPALQRLFEWQFGVVTTAQAIAHGESYETIERRVRQHDWWRPLPRVLTPAGIAMSFESRLSAATLSIGGRLAFAGTTAAAIWRLPNAQPPCRLHVVVEDNRHARSSEFVYVQRRSGLLRRTSVRSGWPVVSLEAAVLGAVSGMEFTAVLDLVQDLLRLRRTSTARLESVTGRGIKGSTMLAGALAIAGDGLGSKWERRLARLLRERGRPRLRTQFRVESPTRLVAYLDLAFPDVRLAIEIDGYVAHSRPAEFRYDRRRQNALVVELGWTVLRYTPLEIATSPDRVVAEIWRCYDRLRAKEAS